MWSINYSRLCEKEGQTPKTPKTKPKPKPKKEKRSAPQERTRPKTSHSEVRSIYFYRCKGFYVSAFLQIAAIFLKIGEVAGMKEAVVASHNQDTISAVHKIERLFKFFVSHGCMRFATLIRISSVAAIRPLLCV